jgi:RNA polymerase sigma-70 factor (ECF subfamily)
MITQYSQESFVSCLRQGDRKAFQQLYNRYYKVLLSVITPIVKDPEEAEDVLHDTYTKVWQRSHSYDPQRGSLYNWILNIARNSAFDAIRRRKGIELTPYTEISVLPMSTIYWPVIETIEVERLVRQVLSPRHWQVVELAYWHGYTHQEIADQLALPLGTVKTRLHQSICQLRPFFNLTSKNRILQREA